jgi:integrase
MRRTIYKRTARSGKRKGKPEPKWTIGYQLADGTMAYERAFTDKQASEQLLAQREREVARGVVGLSTPFDEAKAKPIAEHLDAYVKSLRLDCTPKWAARVESRLRRAVEAMRLRTLAGITMEATSAYVVDAATANGWSTATRNHVVATLRAFAEWCVTTKRLEFNPLRELVQSKVTDADRTETSRVLTLEELQQLCAVAPPSRRLLYLFTAYTGFRRGEDRATTWADVFVDSVQPFVRIRGANAKNGGTVDVPVPGWLADELRRHRAAVTLRAGGKLDPSKPVFHVPAAIVKQLRQDAARAKLGTITKQIHRTPNGNRWTSVEWNDPAGPEVTLKLHGLRAYFVTALFEAGTPPHEVQRLARHANIATTLRHYTAFRQQRMRAAVDALPSPLVAVPVSVPAPVAGIPSSSPDGRPWPAERSPKGGQSLAE